MKLLWVILFCIILFPAYGQGVSITKEHNPHLNFDGLFTRIIYLHPDESNGGEPDYAIVRSTLASSGSSRTISGPNGNYYVSQSIGQSSVIGSHTYNKYTILQGYQQPLYSNKKGAPPDEYILQARIYPNPFKYTITISLNDLVTDKIITRVYDASGKAVLQKKFPASNQITLMLTNIPKGIYTIKVFTGNKSFSAKLIKE